MRQLVPDRCRTETALNRPRVFVMIGVVSVVAPTLAKLEAELAAI
jgi:hypothetical protein